MSILKNIISACRFIWDRAWVMKLNLVRSTCIKEAVIMLFRQTPYMYLMNNRFLWAVGQMSNCFLWQLNWDLFLPNGLSSRKQLLRQFYFGSYCPFWLLHDEILVNNWAVCQVVIFALTSIKMTCNSSTWQKRTKPMFKSLLTYISWN